VPPMIVQMMITYGPLAGLMLLIGMAGGFLSGLLGVGGGFLLVPGLYFSLSALGYESDYLMHISVGTSLGIVAPTVFSSARAHYKKNAVDMLLFKSWTPGMILGVILGIGLASILKSHSLTLIFAGVALVMAFYMSFSPHQDHPEHKAPSGFFKYPIAAGIGIIASLMGIGGAIVSVPTMTLFKVKIQKAIGTAAAMGVVTASLGLIGYMVIGSLNTEVHLPPLSVGYVNIFAVVLIAPVTISIAPFGAHAAHKVPQQWLKRTFAVLLTIVSIKMFFEAGIF